MTPPCVFRTPPLNLDGKVLLPRPDDEPPFSALYPAQVSGVVHVPLPGAFPIAVDESEVPRIERGVEGETLSGDRLCEHIRAGIIAAVKPVIVSPYMVLEKLIMLRRCLADDDLKGMADRSLLWGGAGTDKPCIRSAFQREGPRVLDKFLDSSQELGRLATVDDAVIEAERHIHHRADDDLTTPRDGPLLDLVKA
jgi:hypothetical protein